jgi:hypothetical protein
MAVSFCFGPAAVAHEELEIRFNSMKTLPFVFLASTGLTLMGAFTGCTTATSSNFQPPQLPSIGDRGVQVYLDDDGKEIKSANAEMSTFVRLGKDIEALKSDADKRREFVQAGLNVSDHLADQWFRYQFARDVSTRHDNNTFNIAASGLTAVLGITDASEKAVALLGAATATTNAQWKNYEASYLLSSALPRVLKKLREYRHERRNEILERYRDKASMPGYYEAITDLRSYHQTASREVVKQFIEDSAELAEFAPKFDADAGVKGIQVLPMNTALFSVLYPGTAGMFSKMDLVNIQALLSYDETNNLVAAIAATPSGKNLAELIKTISADPARKPTLMKLMLALNGLLKLEDEVQKRVRTADEAAAKLAAAAKLPDGSPAGSEEATKKSNQNELNRLTEEADRASQEAALAKNRVLKDQKDLASIQDRQAKAGTPQTTATVVEQLTAAITTQKTKLVQAQQQLETARVKDTGVRQIAATAQKNAEEISSAASLAAKNAASAYWSRAEKLEIAERLSNQANAALAIAATRSNEAEQAAGSVGVALASEQQSVANIAALEKELLETRTAAKSREEVLTENAAQLAHAENSLKISSQRAAEAEKRAGEAMAALVAKQAEFAKMMVTKAQAVANAVQQQIEKPNSSSEPSVRSIR